MNPRPAWPFVVLLVVWLTVTALVNPAGEFMVNDDWAYVRALEALQSGRGVIATGWGPAGAPAGPSLIVHLLWAELFVQIFGFSLTVLRVAVLTMGVIGSVAFLALLRSCGTSQPVALLATLTLVFNPLFLSQCFTFMTDVTFTGLAICSVALLANGAEQTRARHIVLGLVLACAATLTRQIGLALVAGFVVCCLVHPKGKDLGRLRTIGWAVGIGLVPWVGWEFFLFHSGSTPFWQHQAIQRLLGPFEPQGLPAALGVMGKRLFVAVAYLALLTAPVLAVTWTGEIRSRRGMWLLLGWTLGFFALEAAILRGLVEPPVLIHGNVISAGGIGPVALKDTYIFGTPRGTVIGPALFYALVYVAGLAAAAIAGLTVQSVASFRSVGASPWGPCIDFLPTYALTTSCIYLALICVTGFHDRHVVPLCALVIVWAVSLRCFRDHSSEKAAPSMIDFSPWPCLSSVRWAAALGLLGLIAIFSIAGTRDFMAMKRSLSQAHRYLLAELALDPCHCDGGFEFNGYHCYRNEFVPKPGLSWWWVEREDYVVTLGPLPGFRPVQSFPYRRSLASGGAVFVLKPADQY